MRQAAGRAPKSINHAKQRNRRIRTGSGQPATAERLFHRGAAVRGVLRDGIHGGTATPHRAAKLAAADGGAARRRRAEPRPQPAQPATRRATPAPAPPRRPRPRTAAAGRTARRSSPQPTEPTQPTAEAAAPRPAAAAAGAEARARDSYWQVTGACNQDVGRGGRPDAEGQGLPARLCARAQQPDARAGGTLYRHRSPGQAPRPSWKNAGLHIHSCKRSR